MSASQEKKRRSQLREEGKEKHQIAQQKAEKSLKHRHRIWNTVGIIAAVAVILLLIYSSGVFYTNFTALQVGDTNYTAAEYNFFYNLGYNNFVNQYGQYLTMMGLDTTKSLSSQQYADGETWDDFFKEQAQTSLKEMTAFYDDAMKNGFVLSEDEQASVDSAVESFKTGYTDAGYKSAGAYIEATFGKGCTIDTVKELIEKYYISQSYQQQKEDSLTYTNDQLKTYYSENKDSLDNFTYIACYIDGSVKDDTGTDTEDASDSSEASSDAEASPSASPDTEAETAEAMAEAKSTADNIAAAGTSEDAFEQAALDGTGSEASASTTQGSSLNEKYAEWMKDSSRKAGDTTVAESDTGYYAVYFISRSDNNYHTVNVRHILIKAVADDDGNYTDEAKAEAKQKAEDLLAEWKAGDATEDSFSELANDNSEDTGSNTNGGLYEDVTKGKMVEQFNDWCFDPSRGPGDTGIVYGESDSYCGYHVMYFVSTSDELYCDKLAENAERSDDFSAWKDGLLANYEVKTGFTSSLVKKA